MPRVIGDRLRGSDRVVRPGALVTGDVLAAIHREGGCWATAPATSRRRCRWCWTTWAAPASPSSWRRRTFHLPPYPYDRLEGLAKLAEAHEGGMVDCSIGTPCAPRPRRRRRPGVLGHQRGYPASAGSAQLREAAAAWLARRSAWRRCRCRRSRRASGPRSWSPPCRTSSACASRRRTRCSTRRCRTPRTPWARSSPDVAPFPSPRRGTRGRPGSQCHRVGRRRARPGAVVQFTFQPDRRPRGPRGGGSLGACARRPSLLRRVLRRVHLDGPLRSVLEHGRDGWWRCTPSRSVRTWPASVSASTLDAELVEFLRRCASTPGSWSPDRLRPPVSPRWRTTPTSMPNGRATASDWSTWAGCWAATAAR